jgi:hypothetical protein
MSGGIGGEFLQILKGIACDSLPAKDVVELRAALLEALAKTDEWFARLAEQFGGVLPPAVAPKPAKVDNGRPPAQLSPPRPSPTVSAKGPARTPPVETPKRKRGRPPKAKPARPAATPLAVGGADAETQAGPQAAKLFENSYVSKDGPQPGAALPAGHPRLHINRESSVTPEVDMSDFHEVETAMRTGKGLKDVFQ